MIESVVWFTEKAGKLSPTWELQFLSIIITIILLVIMLLVLIVVFVDD